ARTERSVSKPAQSSSCTLRGRRPCSFRSGIEEVTSHFCATKPERRASQRRRRQSVRFCSNQWWSCFRWNAMVRRLFISVRQSDQSRFAVFRSEKSDSDRQAFSCETRG